VLTPKQMAEFAKAINSNEELRKLAEAAGLRRNSFGVQFVNPKSVGIFMRLDSAPLESLVISGGWINHLCKLVAMTFARGLDGDQVVGDMSVSFAMVDKPKRGKVWAEALLLPRTDGVYEIAVDIIGAGDRRVASGVVCFSTTTRRP